MKRRCFGCKWRRVLVGEGSKRAFHSYECQVRWRNRYPTFRTNVLRWTGEPEITRRQFLTRKAT